MFSRTISGACAFEAHGWNAWCGSSETALLHQSADYESPQKLLVNIRRQIGFRVCRCDLCNRRAYTFVYRGRQKGVDVARMRPAEHRCHARDLSALVDLVSHGCEEVGTCGKQRVKVGHLAVLVDEGMGPVEAGVQGASHDLSPAVDTGGYGGKISRQSAEACECAVLPKRAKFACAFSIDYYPNSLALVVNSLGGSASSEVLKRDRSAVFPRYRVLDRTGAGSRVAYGVALIVDRECDPVWIAIHRRKSSDFTIFP